MFSYFNKVLKRLSRKQFSHKIFDMVVSCPRNETLLIASEEWL